MSDLATLQANFATLQAEVAAHQFSDNQYFLLTMGLFVFLMQLGFAFLEAGSVRSKNTTNILLKNLLDAVLGALSYWAFGWAFAYGNGNTFIGHSNFFLADFDRTRYAEWFFQFVFAATAATIVSGAVAERCSFVAYISYSIFITGFVYPVGTHWAWDATGWLADGPDGIFFKDFAGSAIVHVVGGTAALIGAIALGPRIGRFTDGKDTPIPGHSVAFTALGGLILWVGFYAFNGGSQLAITSDGDGTAVSLVFVNTTLAGAGGALIAMLIKFFEAHHYISLLTGINGLLAGMVSICASCNAVEPWAAFVIGCIGGVVYTAWSKILVKLRIDDPLDASPVHLGCGIWGALSAPIFANGNIAYEGIFFNGSSDAFKSFGWNLAGVLVYIAWTAVLSGALFFGLRFAGKLRVTETQERVGMDEKKHNEPAYPEMLELSKMSFANQSPSTVEEIPVVDIEKAQANKL